MNAFQKLVMDTEAHATKVVWWNRIIPYRSYVKGFKISPSHYINMDLATIWLDK
jgi:peptide/nickel transport system substrate-binding protein